ncbi:MAG TPA: HU family DNA-binding protein [Williamwhitmania sp.]|nr:HU family DNA-binding protein [Williamwhitmania sp.]
MKYHLIERINPQDRQAKKWYASTVNDGMISKTELAKEITGMSSLSRGDVSNVIESLLEAMPKYLVMGKSVSLGEFGSLRLSISSDGVDTLEEFNTGKITGVKVIFTPGVELKRAIEAVSFERTE